MEQEQKRANSKPPKLEWRTTRNKFYLCNSVIILWYTSTKFASGTWMYSKDKLLPRWRVVWMWTQLRLQVGHGYVLRRHSKTLLRKGHNVEGAQGSSKGVVLSCLSDSVVGATLMMMRRCFEEWCSMVCGTWINCSSWIFIYVYIHLSHSLQPITPRMRWVTLPMSLGWGGIIMGPYSMCNSDPQKSFILWWPACWVERGYHTIFLKVEILSDDLMEGWDLGSS